MIRTHASAVAMLACIAAFAPAGCGERDAPAARAPGTQDLRPDGTLVDAAPAQRQPAQSQSAPPPRPDAPPIAPVPAAEAAVRAAGAALYSPVSEYTKEISDLVAGFPAYLPVPSLAGATIRVRGSDSMGPFISNAALRFESIYPDVRLVVRTGGTERGLASLLNGECEVAAVAGNVTDAQRAAVERETGMRLFVVPVALDGVCVYVNADNPLRSITKAQCNGLFSITHSMLPAPILRWNEIDPNSPLGDEFPPLYITDSSSGTLQTFIDWCMPGEKVTTILRYDEPGPGSVVNACCAYPAAVGVAGYGARQARARAVAVDAGDGRGPVAPGANTIRDRSYPLVRPLNLAFVAKDAASIDPVVVQLLRYLWSEDGQDVAAMSKVVPPTMDLLPVDAIGAPTGDLWK